jgi:tetratricopeptide (TPR) repeat protein
MARHPYLDDVRPPATSAGAVRAGVVAVLVLAWLALVFAAPANGWPLSITIMSGVMLVVAVFAGYVKAAMSPKTVRAIQSAQLARLRERIADSVAQCHALLRRKLAPHFRAQILCVLGECAEVEGDFEEAVAIFTQAEGILRAARMNGVLRAQQLAVVAARRAFAHAACGELDRAEATLRAAGVRDGVPLAGPLTSRATLLILARRGLKQQVTEQLASDSKLLRNTLGFRDRMLVAVIAAFAASRPLPQGVVDEALAQWVGCAFAESKPMLGVA